MTDPLFLDELTAPLPVVGTRFLLAGDEGRHAAVVRRIRPGEMVMSPPPMMNFDDAAYPDPLSVDFSRRIHSLGSFGQGPHRCVGATLARSELGIFLEEWLKRIPDFEVAQPAPRFQGGVNISYAQLNLRWGV